MFQRKVPEETAFVCTFSGGNACVAERVPVVAGNILTAGRLGRPLRLRAHSHRLIAGPDAGLGEPGRGSSPGGVAASA
jgi:hypothetical protein